MSKTGTKKRIKRVLEGEIEGESGWRGMRERKRGKVGVRDRRRTIWSGFAKLGIRKTSLGAFSLQRWLPVSGWKSILIG